MPIGLPIAFLGLQADARFLLPAPCLIFLQVAKLKVSERKDKACECEPVRRARPDLPFAASDENLPWVEKYRPSELSELISHQEIINTSASLVSALSRLALARCLTRGRVCVWRAVSRLIDTNKMPHLLLYGPPGTGKTSTVLACARKLNGPAYKSMILEVSAGFGPRTC